MRLAVLGRPAGSAPNVPIRVARRRRHSAVPARWCGAGAHSMTEIARAGARVGTLVAVSVANLLRGFLGGDVPVRVEAYDGSVLGPVGASHGAAGAVGGRDPPGVAVAGGVGHRPGVCRR